MKGADMAEISMDKLLDFSTDMGEEGDDDGKTRRALAMSSSSLPERGGPFPETGEEEELEWLSNKDAFPEVESLLDIFSFGMPAKFAKQRSPVSVLETSSGGGGTSCVVRWRTGLRVPVKARTVLRRRRRRAVDYSWSCAPRKSKGVVGESERAGQWKAGGGGRKCVHCQSEKTPQWRAGPEGPKTLCNACGVRFKSGRLVPEYRPASSPTFSEEMHSNSHRKIMEMRRVNQTAMG